MEVCGNVFVTANQCSSGKLPRDRCDNEDSVEGVFAWREDKDKGQDYEPVLYSGGAWRFLYARIVQYTLE
jgi:hypothetical protein